MVKDIGIRYEGGTGDVLLFHRFLPALQEKYPEAQFTAYLDTEGNEVQGEVLDYLYGSQYKDIFTIDRKKYKEFYIDSQWGTENQIGFIENVPDDWAEKMNSHDLLIDGHIDSLKWLDYDFDWPKYFRKFPKPDFKPIDCEPYLVAHLVSTTSPEHRMEDWYVTSLVKELHSMCQQREMDLYLISTPEINHFYDEVKDLKGIEIINRGACQVCELILSAKGMVSTDSGFRVVAYSMDIPVVSFSKQCSQPGRISPSHIIRWNPFPETTFPLHWNSTEVAKLMGRCLDHPVYRMFPEVSDWPQQLIKRDYKVNEEKSIL